MQESEWDEQTERARLALQVGFLTRRDSEVVIKRARTGTVATFIASVILFGVSQLPHYSSIHIHDKELNADGVATTNRWTGETTIRWYGAGAHNERVFAEREEKQIEDQERAAAAADAAQDAAVIKLGEENDAAQKKLDAAIKARKGVADAQRDAAPRHPGEYLSGFAWEKP